MNETITPTAPAADLTDETIPPVPDLKKEPLAPVPLAFPPFKLMATIKKSSKHYHEGLIDPTDRKSKARAFPVQALLRSDADDSHDFRLNNNNYRREDLQLWIEVAGKLKKL